MPESLSSSSSSTPQMLGKTPAAHNILNALPSQATDLIRQFLQHQLLQQQQQQQQQQRQAEASSTAAAAATRSSTSSPENLNNSNHDVSLDGEDDEVRPESSSPPPPSTSRSSSRGNNPNSIRPQRKLKIYGVEEKLDIIDYAKMIGNRAAGREYNVAESSIREWRKNETKLRTQAENARAAQNPNVEKEAFYEKLYAELVKFINSEGDSITWKMVRDRCKELWDKMGSGFPEGQVSMHLQGWVARFIQKARQAKDIPDVPPPIPSTSIASTSTSTSSCLSGITMVPSSSAVDLSIPSPSTSSQPPPPKRSRISSSNDSSSSSTLSNSKSSKLFVTPQQIPKSRRKNMAPKRISDATVKTSSQLPLDLSTSSSSSSSTRKNAATKKLPSDAENDEENAIEVC